MIFSRSKNPASTDGPRKRPDSQSPSTTVTTSLSPSHHHGDPEVVSSSTPPQKERNDDKILPDDTKTASVSSDTKSMPTDVLQSPSSSRRRAAVTQGTVPGGTCSAPAVLTLSSYIPNATSAPGIPNRHSESASIGSSSFCSLVDQGLCED